MNEVFMSALGRNVTAGSLYNYFNDEILTNDNQREADSELILTESKVTYSFLTQRPDEYKKRILGVDEHFQWSIVKGLLDEKDLWFGRFLLQDEKVAYASESIKKVVCLSLYVRVIVGRKKLEEKDIDVQIYNCYEKNDGGATHIVEKVEYGAEFLCLMHKEINREDREEIESNKELIRRSMKSTAKTLLDQVTVDLLESNESGDYTYGILCTVISSLDPDKKEIMSLEKFGERLRNVTRVDSRQFRPVLMTLRRIPERMETLVALEAINYSMGMLSIVKYISSESHNKLVVTPKLAEQYPPIQLVTSQFKDVLMKIVTQWSSRSNSTKQPHVPVKRDVSDDLLSNMIDWVDERVREIDMLSRVLLSDTGVSVCDSKALLKQLVHKEHKEDKVEQKKIQVFLLKVDYVPDSVVEQMAKLVSDADERAQGGEIDRVHRLPVFRFFSLEHDEFEKHVKLVHSFVETAKSNGHSPYILLASSDFKQEEGEITTEAVAEFLQQSMLDELLSHDDQPKNERPSEFFSELTGASQQDSASYYKSAAQCVDWDSERRRKKDDEANNSEDGACLKQRVKPLIQMKITPATSANEQELSSCSLNNRRTSLPVSGKKNKLWK